MRLSRSLLPVAIAALFCLPGYAANNVFLDAATVREAQERLISLGYYKGRADGVLGPATQAALATFQRDQMLPATGRIDGDTLVTLHGSETVANR